MRHAGDSLDAKAARDVFGQCCPNKRGCTGHARDARKGVFAMDGLREPAEALRKKMSLRGLRRADKSDALTVSNDCGRDARRKKNRTWLKARS